MLYVIKLVFEMVNAKFFRNFDGNALSPSGEIRLPLKMQKVRKLHFENVT